MFSAKIYKTIIIRDYALNYVQLSVSKNGADYATKLYNNRRTSKFRQTFLCYFHAVQPAQDLPPHLQNMHIYIPRTRRNRAFAAKQATDGNNGITAS